MKKFNHWLNGLTLKLSIAIIVLTGFNYALKSCRVQQKRAELSRVATEAEKSGERLEIVFAHRDGKDPANQEMVKPYTEVLDRLKQRCKESRTELLGMAGALTKHEKKNDSQTTYLEGLELFSDLVESGFERFPATCMEAYTAHVKNAQD